MKCKQCGIQEAVGWSQYCSESCKTVYNRNKRNKKPEQTRPLDGVVYDDLYRAVCCYPSVSWKQSPEYKEIMHRLHTMTVEQLELEGQFVPCWKYQQEAVA